nr:DUF1365 domain-containing protein [Nakamurella flavida]
MLVSRAGGAALPEAEPAALPVREPVGGPRSRVGRTAMIYRARTVHQRFAEAPGATRRRFAYATTSWLIDVDAPPVPPRPLAPFARFLAADHLGTGPTLAGNARALLAEHGMAADTILLLTGPRILGHVFNPLSVFYCLRGGETVAVLAEVHNTYGGRHVYVLRPDATGRDEVDKQFYVSPFLPSGGRYRMRVPVPGDRLSVAVTLEQDGRPLFVATLTGAGSPATAGRQLATALLRPLSTLRTSALIRWQGIRIWLRRIPVQPRPADATADERGR